ncbi:glycoside hydrolase family 5 protein [Ruminococcus albus]|jgi:aryl-phospho-beta-D-glucosidase BglC (GH1 family)|uniref:cellulase n=1 Tax=Ruminococcus albus SY3 TaxID=1341156 RepID=A0A011V4L2_RUMAL|nr:glycoside hydrolase family 5 protein [Ruminococcus albus]EXM40437.1 cellulose 1,4-beta-cellobiosidase [Ruminococcus albus SY3]
MLKKLISGLTAAASACTIVLAPASGIAEKSAAVISASAATADSYHDDWLHVNENAEVVDMNGNPVWMTGCNWFGYNVGSQVFDGVWSLNMHQALNEIADHGFNLLRVPMSTEILLQWKNRKPDPIIKLNEWKNPELTLEGVEGGTPMYSFDIWNKAVEWCRENGIKIMMDVHCATTNAAGHNYALWYDSNYSEKDWLDALAWFADYYKDDDTIIAIDLKNEPHGKKDDGIFAKWDGSSDANNWRYAAEKGAKACLDKNPNLLIMVEGIEVYPKFEKGFDWNSGSTDYAHYGDPDYQPYHGAWWGGNFRGARDYPVNLGKYQSQLVYSPHDYGPLVYEQSWFHLQGKGPNYTSYEFDRKSLLKEYWYDSWAFLVEEKISPLLMGEWGGRIDSVNDPSGANKHWMEVLRDYMIEKRIHHTFWCFNENSSDTGGLIASDGNWDHWDEEKYEFVKPSLWQDEKGKFISLDHKIKLGQSGNGISLSDYYSTSHSDPDPDPDPQPQNNDYPKNVKVNYSTQYHQVQFIWDKVQGADKYGIAVYLAGKWRVQTSNITTNNYVTPKNLTPGMTYKVAVAARVNGKWNTTDPIKNAITVTIK